MHSNRAALCLLGASLAAAGCTGQEARFRQQQERFESLASTTAAIARAWLDGRTSGTYTGTALEQTLTQVEQARSTLVSAPEALADPRGAALSESAEHLSRVIAALSHDVEARDAASARRDLAGIPFNPPGQP